MTGCTRVRNVSAYGYPLRLKTKGVTEKQVLEKMANCARQSIDRTGVWLFEFKVGKYSVDTDIETVLTVRSAVDTRIALSVSQLHF